MNYYDSYTGSPSAYAGSPTYDQYDQGSPYEVPGECQPSNMARYGSSSGSSIASSIPDSPLGYGFYSLHGSPSHTGAAVYDQQTYDQQAYDQQAYEQQQFDQTPYDQQYSPPEGASGHETMVPRSEAVSGSRDWPVFCLAPECNARPFKRQADLQRHYRNTHAPDTAKDRYLCDYPRCNRNSEPFHRRDHFRDHLREYHREDIQKRGDAINAEWLESRYTPSSWWRCPRCLHRVHVRSHQFECPSCKTTCEPKRKERRRRSS